MRVGLFTESYDPIINGVSTSVKTLAAELTALGHIPIVVAPRYPGFRDEPDDNAPDRRRLPSWRTPLNPENPFAFPPLGVTPRTLRGIRFDIVHSQQPFGMGMHARRAARQNDVPLVSTFHTLARVKVEADLAESTERVRAEVSVVGCSDAILANCEEEASDLRQHYGAVAGRIEIIPPGVDHAFFSPGDRAGARQGIGWHDTGPMLLFVGRIQPLKGVDVAVATLAELDDPAARLAVVGGPSGADGSTELERVQQLATDLGVRDRIRFVVPQPHHLLSSWYRAADVVLVPSRSESFGLVALEAAACGRPVVAAAVGGLRTIVEDGGTGFLVDGRMPASYAAAVATLLDDPALAAGMGAAAAQRARGYTWSTAAARLRRLYSDLVARTLVDCA